MPQADAILIEESKLSILDRFDTWNAADPQQMRELLASFPDQFRRGGAGELRLPTSDPPKIDAVVMCGMGGSAMGGDVLRTALGGTLGLPIVVNRDYDLPGFVGASSLILASSYSGNTEETLSCYREARRRRASIVCVTSGGTLHSMAESDGMPCYEIPAGIPPRAALGYSTVALLSALEAYNLLPPMSDALEETARLLRELAERYGPSRPERENAAKLIARKLHGMLVAVYGSERLSAAALRWRGQLEENAKNLAFHHVLPEMNHNEIVGWANPPEVLRQVGVVLLRDREDHPKVRRRFDLTRDLIGETAGVIHTAWTEGNSELARIFSVAYLGDYVSLYLACLNAADPTPVSVIETLKKGLDQPRL